MYDIILLNTLLGGLSIIMIDIMFTVGFFLGVFVLLGICSRLAQDDSYAKFEAEKYRLELRHRIPYIP